MIAAASVGVGLVSCQRPHADAPQSPGSVGLFVDPVDSAHPASADKNSPPRGFELDSRGRDLYAIAAQGEDPDVQRFGEYVGAAGLIELARAKESRSTALAAMAYAPSLSCVGVLAEAAKEGSEDDARVSLESLRTIAARPRVSDDLEDFAELDYACGALLELAKDAEPSRRERARRATSVLRMLADRGCDVSTLSAFDAGASSNGTTSSSGSLDAGAHD
jgi:hypothetical protein